MKKVQLVAIALLVPFGVPADTSFGELITIGLRAEVTYVEPGAYDLLEGQLQLGDLITGSYSYDAGATDRNPSSWIGDYRHTAGPYGFTLDGAGFVFASDPGSLDFVVTILDNYNGNDTYCLLSHGNLTLSNGVAVSGIYWQLDDYSCTALSSDALPLGPPILSDWEYQGLSIELGPKGGANIGAQVTSVWLIPEPATVLLLGCGGLLILRKRR